MTNLPLEILHLIFSSITQKDKLECMTVCRQWCDAIRNHSLFRDLFIYRQEQLDQLIERVKREPLLGTKVERLTLQFQLDKDYDAEPLSNLFPNVRDFALINLKESDRRNQVVRPWKSHNPWCESLRTMIENSPDLNTVSLLSSGLCKNLTFLTVKRSYDQRPRTLMKALANAPALKELHLKRCDIEFDDLELLHRNVPQLHTLVLKGVKFCYKRIPRDIKPATSMRVLLLDLTNVFSRFGEPDRYLPYITQKYTHLEELKCELDKFDTWSEGSDDCEKEEELAVVLISYMTTLAPRLKTLSLTLSDEYAEHYAAGFDFDELDEAGCQIKKLTFGAGVSQAIMAQLLRTAQVQYIQSLTINRLVHEDWNSNSITLKWLKRFTALKELTLHCPVHFQPERESNGLEFEEGREPVKRYELSLTHLLSVLSKKRLETLVLYHPHLEYNDSTWNLVYPWLKNLTLCGITFETGTDLFISRAFPNLRRLTLQNCFSKESSFNLPSTDLSYLEIINISNKMDFTVMVTTINNGQQRVYNTTQQPSSFRCQGREVKDDIFNLPPVSSRPFDTSKDTPTVKIVCRSLYSFFMKNIKLD